jgi:hypothetical protein
MMQGEHVPRAQREHSPAARLDATPRTKPQLRFAANWKRFAPLYDG